MMPGIVGVRHTEQSAGIVNLTSQSNEKLGYDLSIILQLSFI